MIFNHPYRNLLIALALTFMSYPFLIVGGNLGRALELLMLILVMGSASLVRFGRTRRSFWIIALSSSVIMIWSRLVGIHVMDKTRKTSRSP